MRPFLCFFAAASFQMIAPWTSGICAMTDRDLMAVPMPAEAYRTTLSVSSRAFAGRS